MGSLIIERLFIVGIKAISDNAVRAKFCWPLPLPAPPLKDFLDPPSQDDNHERLPPSKQRTARRHVKGC